MGDVQTLPGPRASAPEEPGMPPERPSPRLPRRAPRQLALAIRAQVAPSGEARLKRILGTMARDPGGNERLPFGALPRTHFGRLVLLDGTYDLDGGWIEPQLLLMVDVDEPDEAAAHPVERCLEELVDTAGDGLDDVFGSCVGYPDRGRATRGDRLAFLRQHLVAPAAMYVNTIGRSVDQIRHEARLRDAIGTFLDTAAIDWSSVAPEDVRATIQGFVASRDDLAWASQPPPSIPLRDRALDTVRLLALPAGVAALSPVVVPAVATWAVLLRLLESRDEEHVERPSAEHVQLLAELEDHGVQNAFSAVGFIKPGLVRQLTTEVVTRGIDYASRYVYRRADLAGVTTIHFARWVFLDDRRRMIFASNYDGSLEGYNNDFIHIVWWGLNAVFSNGVGYPRTRWLFLGGARQEQAFKNYLRRHQVPTQVWYSAYPDLTAANIDNNACIRAGLHGRMSREETRAWLRRL